MLPRVARPWLYRWVRRGPIGMAGTITVITGSTVEQALRAFGADPGQPDEIEEIQEDVLVNGSLQAWVTVRDLGDAVLVAEENSFLGIDEAVLRAASAGGRAASMFWNVRALTRLSFAEDGRLIAAEEPFGHEKWPPELSAVLDGLDFAANGDRVEKGLVAVERFTGHGITEADIARIFEVGVGYRVRSRQ